MNRYGRLALTRWQQLAPTALAEITDPSQHFSMLGEEALEQVTTLTLQLQGQDVPGETTFAKIGRIENAKLRAEEIVQADLLTPPPDLQDLTEDEIEDNLPADPVDQALSELREELKRLPEG